jgi:hypothetical protein
MFSITYGTGKIKGELVKETLKVGDIEIDD